MKKLSRAKNTMRNTLWGAIYRVATLIGPFAIKTIIIKELGQEYNGLSTLFTSVLTVLNLANLGFNSSLVFTMYKAIAEDDKPALCAMLKFYRKVYRIVGLVILGMGLAVMPFLPWLVKNDCPPDVNLYVLFAIYLSESVLDYLMFAYNNATFTAFQRNDVTLKISTVRYVVQYTLQAAVLLIFSNYYAYIILLPLMVIPNNVAVYLAARKHYPDIVCQGELDPVTKKDIYKRVGTLFGHKLGNTFLVSIDSIIISSFLGLTALSLYSNYYYILTAVNGLVEIVTNGSLSGIGNKLLTDSREDNYRFFKTMTYGWVALVGGAAACMLCFYQPFIAAVWLGPEYLLDERLMMLIVLYFFSWMFRIMQLTYRDAAGLWTEDWLKPYVGMAVNLVGSIWMVKATGSIAGVLVPTILVFFFIYTPWEAWVVVKYQFYRSWNEYMGKLLGYVLLALVAVDWGLRQKTITPLFGRMAVKLCATLPDKLRLILKSGSELDALAAYLTGYDRLLFVGQNIDLAAAGAMAGVWSRTLGVPVETVPAAELRHTLLPTVDSHTALVALISSRELTEKTCAALQLAAIRGAGTVACTVESLAGQLSGARQVFLFPDSLPLLAPVCQCATLSMLLLRLCTAREQAGRPVEQPPVLPRYFAG